MTKEEKYKAIALELLEKYVDAEETVISEFSGDFRKSIKILEEKVIKYLKKLDAMDYLDEIKKDKFIFEDYEGDEDDD